MKKVTHWCLTSLSRDSSFRLGEKEKNMRVRRFLIRYHPPGIIIEYEKRGTTRTKDINLFDLEPASDPQQAIVLTFLNNRK